MKIVLSIIFLAIVWVTLVSSQTTTKAPSIPSFDAYKKTFNKKYADTKTTKSGKTEEQAKQAYANAVQRINKHNSQKNRTYTRSVNPMSDLTAKEFKSQKTGYNYTQVKSSLKNAQSRYSSKSNNKNYKSSGTSFPTSAFKKFDPVQGGYNSTKVSAQMRILKQSLKGNLDLRPKMSAVRNQEQCGSCWAFAAVAVLEYESNIAGTNLDLSEQHLVDCETNSFGCDGGSPLNALLFAYAKGVALESNVPYKAVKGTCASPTPLTKIPNVCFLLEGSEAYLFYIMNKFNKPVVVAINTVGTGLQDYSSGIFNDPNCSSDPAAGDHAVVVVGYGADTTGAFWIIKNSWGSSWGENGYFRLAMLEDNKCGVGNVLSFVCSK